jgi:hypothetical protein
MIKVIINKMSRKSLEFTPARIVRTVDLNIVKEQIKNIWEGNEIESIRKKDVFIQTSSLAKQQQAMELGIGVQAIDGELGTKQEKSFLEEKPLLEGIYATLATDNLFNPSVSLHNAVSKISNPEIGIGALGNDSTIFVKAIRSGIVYKLYLDTALSGEIKELNIDRILKQVDISRVYVENSTVIKFSKGEKMAITAILGYEWTKEQFENIPENIKLNPKLPIGINLADPNYFELLREISLYLTKNGKVLGEYLLSNADWENLKDVPRGLSKGILDLFPLDN